jgi:16S rRNA (guanine966-N2)-methyltransferase
MRIISGKYRSRKLFTPTPNNGSCVKDNLSGFRPTTDRARETLFNVLNNLIDFESVSCLDLFAGSGALGFEAISRGAEECDFVESYTKCAQNIQRSASELGCSEKIRIFNEDALRFLSESEGKFYDLVFADPPYDYEHYNEVITGVLSLKFSIFVLEYGTTGGGFMYDVKGFDIIDKKIGVTNFKIFITADQ